MSIETILSNSGLNSGWELINNQRRTFEYTGENITTINLEVFEKGSWKKVFKQELTYDGSSNLLTITGIKL